MVLFCEVTNFTINIPIAASHTTHVAPSHSKEECTMAWRQPNPDDRSDNVEKLQSMVQNTLENIEEAEESLAFAESEEQRRQIKEKNHRREVSIQAMRNEIQEEAADRESGYTESPQKYE
jgi:small acid-soluble spore protein (thioredoxin-like protein)